MSRYETHHTTFECEHCGAVQRGTVTVDTLSGVAGARCQECGKMTEPVPVADEDDLLGEYVNTSSGETVRAFNVSAVGEVWFEVESVGQSRTRSQPVEAFRGNVDAGLFERVDEAETEAAADARAEIEAEGRLDDRRERHVDRHGWFG